MKRKIPAFKILIFCMLLAALSGAGLRAEDTAVPELSPAEIRLAQWKQMRQDNPEEFRRLMSERKAKLQTRLQEYRQQNPERFGRFKERLVEDRRSRLQEMREKDPEAFQQVMQRKMARMEELKQKNPERYQQFLKKHPGFEERAQKYRDHFQNRRAEFSSPGNNETQRLRQENSEKFQQALRQRQQLRALKETGERPGFQQGKRRQAGSGRRPFGGTRDNDRRS